MDTVWEFDIAVTTHKLLKQGITVAAYRQITVLAATYTDASLIAYALAAAPDNATVTDILLRL